MSILLWKLNLRFSVLDRGSLIFKLVVESFLRVVEPLSYKGHWESHSSFYYSRIAVSFKIFLMIIQHLIKVICAHELKFGTKSTCKTTTCRNNQLTNYDVFSFNYFYNYFFNFFIHANVFLGQNWHYSCSFVYFFYISPWAFSYCLKLLIEHYPWLNSI